VWPAAQIISTDKLKFCGKSKIHVREHEPPFPLSAGYNMQPSPERKHMQKTAKLHTGILNEVEPIQQT